MAASAVQLTHYHAELQRIEDEIDALRGVVLEPPVIAERATRYVYRWYQRASLSGNLEQLQSLIPLIDHLIAQPIYAGDLYLLKANVAFKLHRLDEVKRCFAAMPSAFESPAGRAMLADLDFQSGRYEDAKQGLERAIEEDRTWDTLARLAHLVGKLEGADAAQELYRQAEDELTSKEMRSYAWIEVQRGLLEMQRGRYDEAHLHYERAGRAFSGYWYVEEHAAELLGAEGKYLEAAAVFERIASAAPRPDIEQAIGELYALAGHHARALEWQQRALKGYLDSARRGEVHYYHHLADYYSDVAEDGHQAVKWASKDAALRENFSTQSALAWALYRDGRFEEALEWSLKALGSGVISAKIYFQAAKIHQAAGRRSEADHYLELATAINPLVDHFHVHH